MATVSVGKIRPTFKGNYTADTTYAVMDVVVRDGASYVCMQQTQADPSTSSDWRLLASRGAKGDQGLKGDTGIQGPKGDKGATGASGAPFVISRTFQTVGEMESSASEVELGEMVIIASDINDEDNAKLYVRAITDDGYYPSGFRFLADLSGSPGIRGPQGEQGPKGDKMTFTDLSAAEKLALKGDTGAKGDKGDTGSQGAVFTPHISGTTLSWTNNGGLSNPAAIDLKGDRGADGAPGAKGDTGPAGNPGTDGVGITAVRLNSNGELIIETSN